jgi:hypothetical protein
MEKSSVIASVCAALSDGGADAAVAILDRDYPFAPEAVGKRRFNAIQYARVFVRDGFIDRYSGDRLVFPPVLRLLSHALPERFPYHPHWKTEVTHPAYWEMGATIDHVVPVARGGADEAANWVTTSMSRNSSKMNWTIAELGWELKPPGDFGLWDGLLPWSLRYASDHPNAVHDNGVRQWLRAGAIVLAEVDKHASLV